MSLDKDTIFHTNLGQSYLYSLDRIIDQYKSLEDLDGTSYTKGIIYGLNYAKSHYKYILRMYSITVKENKDA